MTNEERVLKAVRHLEECLAHLDLLKDEVDSSRVFVQSILSGVGEGLSEQLGQLTKMGEMFAMEGN